MSNLLLTGRTAFQSDPILTSSKTHMKTEPENNSLNL